MPNAKLQSDSIERIKSGIKVQKDDKYQFLRIKNEAIVFLKSVRWQMMTAGSILVN
jgi:hypothetical protein